MKLILRTTALLAFANAISLQTETADYESKMRALRENSDRLIAEIAKSETERWLEGGLPIIELYTDVFEYFGETENDYSVKVKSDDLLPQISAF